MVVSESDAQGSGALKPVQAGFCACLPRVALVIAMGLLTGCSTLGAMNPVTWWHKEQGGKIAEDRPPPPGADEPYPNMSTVPPKPTPPDPAAMKTLTDSLVADRTNAQHAAQAAPLADPSSPAASPGLFGVGTAPPPPPSAASPSAAAGSGSVSASLPAVTAPAAPPLPTPAPRKAVQSAPLEAPRATPTATATPSPSAPTSAAPTSAANASAQPDLPSEPPPRPAAAGQPPPTPVVAAPMPSPTAGVAASIVFVEGSSSLSEPATNEVKAFATKRGNGVIVVTGFGDAAASDPAAQSAALTLGLSRAQAVADTLKATGVPPTAVRVNAEASGRGAALRLLQ